MSINLHLLNATNRLSTLEKRIVVEFNNAVNQVKYLMPVNHVDVVIRASSQVIPETGIAGYCPQDDLVYVSIDPNNTNLLKKFSEEFTATLAHELHHSIRWKEVGYGTTLGEALVSEGLACCFEAELRTLAPPLYAIAVNQDELPQIWKRARNELSSDTYDHFAWFLGKPSRSIPRYAGYSLGYQIVLDYIRSFDIPASKLFGVEASLILENSTSHQIFN